MFFFVYNLYLKTLTLWNLPGEIMSPLSILISLDLKLCILEGKKVWIKIWLNGIKCVILHINITKKIHRRRIGSYHVF